MKEVEKIEKELFIKCNVNSHTMMEHKAITTYNKEHNTEEWAPKLTIRQKSEVSEKLIMLILILLIPFELLYNLIDYMSFKCSKHKRTNEYRKLILGRNLRTIELKQPPLTFIRNKDKLVKQFCSSENQYPLCDIFIWIPEIVASQYPNVPWQRKTVYSVCVPKTFHCYYTNGYISSLHECDWLFKFQRTYNLSKAVPVINYAKQTNWEKVYLRQYAPPIISDDEEESIDCFVELLSENEPMKGLMWEKKDYLFFHVGTFQLKRGSIDVLTERSNTKLNKIMNDILK